MEINSPGARRPNTTPPAALAMPNIHGVEVWPGAEPGEKAEIRPVAPPTCTVPPASTASTAATVLPGKSAEYESAETVEFNSARNSLPFGVTDTLVGKSLEFVMPDTHTLPAESVAMVWAWSVAVPPRNVAHTIALPVGLSLATNASYEPRDGGVGARGGGGGEGPGG